MHLNAHDTERFETALMIQRKQLGLHVRAATATQVASQPGPATPAPTALDSLDPASQPADDSLMTDTAAEDTEMLNSAFDAETAPGPHSPPRERVSPF